jgi:hypothetical protein
MIASKLAIALPHAAEAAPQPESTMVPAKMVILADIFSPCAFARLSGRNRHRADPSLTSGLPFRATLGRHRRRADMSIRRDIRAIAPGASARPALALILNLLLIRP